MGPHFRDVWHYYPGKDFTHPAARFLSSRIVYPSPFSQQQKSTRHFCSSTRRRHQRPAPLALTYNQKCLFVQENVSYTWRGHTRTLSPGARASGWLLHGGRGDNGISNDHLSKGCRQHVVTGWRTCRPSRGAGQGRAAGAGTAARRRRRRRSPPPRRGGAVQARP